MRSNRPVASAIVLAALLAPLSGCHGATGKKPTGVAPGTPAPDTQMVQLTADGTAHFAPSTIAVHPGKVRVILATNGPMSHSFAAPALGVNSGNIPAGKSVTLDFNVPRPGEYPFYCLYHQSQGMTGTIIARQ